MKKPLMISGGIFLILVLLVVTITAIFVPQAVKLDNESKSYVDEVVPKILQDLSVASLSKYASEELLDTFTKQKEKIDSLFNWFKQLGRYEEYIESEGQATISYHTEGNKIISGKYTAKVRFESGPARVDIETIKRDGKWFITSFIINSDALINPPKQSTQ